ncbi:GDSL-type esterase/lipase family protein [Paenibacillus sp. SCIV0701]|uniref:GDSL-type esterase/lipase family protein n=2 Tax=Paenibacillus soyae TaxID=2969249 RepID=A0A9X2MP73_9BACL|nr:GDSL-type esterase/lipase family protein [Paenibacillus soyae]
MQSYSEMQAPQQGWGQQFGRYFADGVVVENHSIGGRSSKSFMVDGRLDTVLREIKPGDFFFISFGHNDASAGIPERYASPADYKTYLARYVNGARQRGATPVLLTPVGRRDFNLVTQEFNVSFPDYVAAAKEVAAELEVALIDLSQLSIAHYNKVGLAATEDIFLYAYPGEYPKYPNGVNDNTHFSGTGARVIAGLVAGAVKEMGLTLSPFVIDPDIGEPEPEPESQLYEENFEGDPTAAQYAMVNATGIAGTMTGTVVEQNGNKLLNVVGSGSGHRAKVFRIFDAIGGDIVNVNFDWHTGNNISFPTEGHLSLQDANENLILTLYTTSVSNSTIGYLAGHYAPDYGTGTTAIPGGQATTIAKNQWVNVDATINFAEKTIDLTLTSLADESITQTIEDIPMSAGTAYADNVRAMRFLGTRKGGGGTLNWTTQIDNVRIEGTTLPPEAADQTALVALRDEAKALDLTGYTEQSKAVLNKAIAAADAIIGTEATQAQIDHAFNMLTVAKASLTSEPVGDISTYRFDFGSGSAAEGYTKVDAKRAYVEGNGYGFADTSLTVDENRETGNALTEDFTRVNGTSFLVEMEPANYRVTMTIGDSQEATNAGVVTEQMTKVPNSTVPSGEFKEISYDIALIDGVFNFEFSGNTPKINALKLERLPDNGAGDKPVIYLASDSTVANYAEGYRPQAGWGETLDDYFDLEQVSIDNRAVGGLSSKTFLVGGYLNDILLGIKEGDYLFMQWSHNDSTPSRPERYLTPEQFKAYLKDYINGAKQRGATPVLVTPVNRRDFTDETLNKSFPEYVQAMKETAQETGTLLVDLNQASWEYFQELGPEGTKDIFMWVDGKEDNTHLQMNGAIKVSEMVARLVKQLNIPLSAFVTVEDTEVPPGEHWAAASVTGPANAYAGQSVELEVGVSQVWQGFTAMDIIVQYDPAKLEFATAVDENGGAVLAENAIAPGRDNLHVVASAIKPAEGQIRVILISAGEDHAVSAGSDLFVLRGKVKADAPLGNVSTSVTKFDVSRDGLAGIANIAQAYHSITIGQVPVESDKSALEKAIASAQAQLAKAAEGDVIGKYEVGSKAELQAAIDAAITVRGNHYATQAQVDAATGALNAAVQQFLSRFISLVDGQTQITIRDLSIIAKYFGITKDDPKWSEIAKADIIGDGEIDIRVLAAVARMILTDWSAQ